MQHPLASFLTQAGIIASLVLGGLPSAAHARARAAVVEPGEPAPTEEAAVAVDTSEIPDFDPSQAEQLAVEATAQAKEFGFDPSQITITIMWLDAASASYGIHVYIETKDAKLADGPRGPMLNRCEQCSQTRVPEAAVEALIRGFELYEDALKKERERRKQEEAQRLDEERNRQALAAEQTISEQEDMARRQRRRRTAGIVLLALGGVTHVLGITLMAVWKVGQPEGLVIQGRELFIPGMVLLSLSPAPIAAGAVYLADYRKTKKQQRANLSLMGLRRGLGLGATVRF